MDCKKCAKQFTCKIKDIKEKLEQITCNDMTKWSGTKNYGIVRRVNHK